MVLEASGATGEQAFRPIHADRPEPIAEQQMLAGPVDDEPSDAPQALNVECVGGRTDGPSTSGNDVGIGVRSPERPGERYGEIGPLERDQIKIGCAGPAATALQPRIRRFAVRPIAAQPFPGK